MLTNMTNMTNIIKKYSSKLWNNIVQYQNSENETIYFDFETTGLNQFHLKIIEYAFLIEDFESENKVNYNEKSDVLITSLINPKIKFDKIDEELDIENNNIPITKLFNWITSNIPNIGDEINKIQLL